MTTQHQNAVRGLYISAIVFASVGMLSKLMGAMGLGMFDPVSLMKQNVVNVGGKSIPVPGAARVASVMNFLMDSLLSLAVLLIAIAIGLQNNYFNKQSDGYEHHEGSDEHHEDSDQHYDGSDEHYESSDEKKRPEGMDLCPTDEKGDMLWGCVGAGDKWWVTRQSLGKQCYHPKYGVLTCGGEFCNKKILKGSWEYRENDERCMCPIRLSGSNDGMYLWGNKSVDPCTFSPKNLKCASSGKSRCCQNPDTSKFAQCCGGRWNCWD